MSNILDSLILSPPNDLCFNCHEFTKESFSVDLFLQEHRNMGNLETMRDDLGVYLKTLRSAMIELINKDYADFVNLSSNLIGLDKAISSIQLPLGQLKEELLVVQNNIEDALNEVTAQLLRRKKLQERKRSLKSLNRVHCSLKKMKTLLNGMNSEQDSVSKPLRLERAAMEYNQLQFHVSRCINDLSEADKQNLENIRKLIFKHLDDQFIQCQQKDKEEQLLRVLGIYLSLGKCSQAEMCYRREKISPVMNQLINEEALASNPGGLKGLYNTLVAFVDEEMKTLRSATLSSDKLGKTKGFDFVVNSFWPEVEERLGLNLASIYAPGNPDNFFMCYSETLEFLTKLEARCDSRSLRAHPQYQSFMHRWNLPVYFQIRFQEIAGSVEAALVARPEMEVEGDWKLTATAATWTGLLRCWADKVYITQLTHRFWKLNLQILGRYYTWTNELLEKKGEAAVDKAEVWVFLYSDVTTLSSRVDQLFQVANSRLHPGVSSNMRKQLQKCLEEWQEKLLSQLTHISVRLVRSVCSASVAALRQVSEVPRLYRRTNRDTPNHSLPYIDTMLDAPLTFYESHQTHPQVIPWLQSVFSEITKQYYAAVMDVLTSVQKTEESLRRLKKIRDRTVAQGSTPDRGGDDDKIRMQLYFDANYFSKKIEEVGIRKENVEQLKDLLKLVETLHNKNGLK
ncbi:conserved oligomeric Golgi complex subunit 2 [Macrosteles quadrilineatus]|uniref:conserved oligomeric Golgi complex subunit 2 n=1 Tax=Macrosteles quadrilineatus TaxID=74068 RepID=UPI0023E18604|nr:conserved oligomeric Golgi complex subunit 2 [Macrosteles quadrilineatus]